MTAPGNTALLIVLLAAFLACCAYAAGRLHQRYQTTRDREEAYRDGYDTATRSVFSLAARVIAPRRSARGSASTRSVTAEAAASGGSAQPKPGAAQAKPGAVQAKPGAAQAKPGTVQAKPGAAQAKPGALPAKPGALPAKPGPAQPRRGSAQPTPSTVHPKPSTVHPQPNPLHAKPNSVHAKPNTALPTPGAGLHASTAARVSADESAEDSAVTTGRHTVPDELVQAATYRLPPDLVFRAKVPDATLPDEQTTRLVPKPRKS